MGFERLIYLPSYLLVFTPLFGYMPDESLLLENTT
jgi:hypothetical protein